MKTAILNLLSHFGLSVSKASSRQDIRRALSFYRPQKPNGYAMYRIGARFDGGYLVPDCLDGVTCCLSPGVDQVAQFENDLAARGIDCHLIDFSVESPPSGANFKSFTRKFLGPVSCGNFLTLSDWMVEIGISKSEEIILQMDIEGAEYASILATPEQILDQFRVIVIELHGLNSLSNRYFLKLFHQFSEKLTKNHQVVHLHPNNRLPTMRIRGVDIHPLLEVTLLRRDMLLEYSAEYQAIFPSKFDMPCVPERKEMKLAEDWYRS